MVVLYRNSQLKIEKAAPPDSGGRLYVVHIECSGISDLPSPTAETTTTSATAAIAARFRRMGFIDFECSAHIFRAVQVIFRFLSFGDGRHLDETESLIADNVHTLDRSVLGEEFFQIGVGGGIIQIPHEQFAYCHLNLK